MYFSTTSFIVRIYEVRTDHSGEVVNLKGSIQRVGSDRVEYFSDLQRVVLLIGRELGLGGTANFEPDSQTQ